MYEDLETLADLPNGTLTIDVLNGAASHSEAPELALYIAGELQAWLQHRMTELRIPLTSLDSATLIAEISTERIATNRKRVISFDFSCSCTLVSGDRSYLGLLNEKHVWHRRINT
jgi:hypothetical protein